MSRTGVCLIAGAALAFSVPTPVFAQVASTTSAKPKSLCSLSPSESFLDGITPEDGSPPTHNDCIHRPDISAETIGAQMELMKLMTHSVPLYDGSISKGVSRTTTVQFFTQCRIVIDTDTPAYRYGGRDIPAEHKTYAKVASLGGYEKFASDQDSVHLTTFGGREEVYYIGSQAGAARAAQLFEYLRGHCADAGPRSDYGTDGHGPYCKSRSVPELKLEEAGDEGKPLATYFSRSSNGALVAGMIPQPRTGIASWNGLGVGISIQVIDPAVSTFLSKGGHIVAVITIDGVEQRYPFDVSPSGVIVLIPMQEAVPTFADALASGSRLVVRFYDDLPSQIGSAASIDVASFRNVRPELEFMHWIC